MFLGSGPDAFAQVLECAFKFLRQWWSTRCFSCCWLIRCCRLINSRTRGRILQLLNPSLQVVAVYCQQRFCLMTLGEFGMILLELDEEARNRLRPKLKQIERDIYHLLQNARPP